MFGKLKAHKKLVMIVLALLGVIATYLTGDCDVSCVIKAATVAVGL